MSITVQKGTTQRTWGGWVRRDTVFLDGVEIGFVQVRRRHGRIETITCEPGGGTVLGGDTGWLKAVHERKVGLAQEPV